MTDITPPPTVDNKENFNPNSTVDYDPYNEVDLMKVKKDETYYYHPAVNKSFEDGKVIVTDVKDQDLDRIIMRIITIQYTEKYNKLIDIIIIYSDKYEYDNNTNTSNSENKLYTLIETSQPNNGGKRKTRRRRNKKTRNQRRKTNRRRL